MLSWLVRTVPAVSVLTVAAFLTGVYWLPVLAVVYTLGSGVEATLAHFKLRLLEDELGALLRTRSEPLPQRLIRPTMAVLSLLWQRLSDRVFWALDGLAQRWLRRRDEHYQERIGQHRWDRFSRYEITGAANQRQVRAEVEQARKAAAQEWLLTNTVDPVVTDGQIHSWIGTAAPVSHVT